MRRFMSVAVTLLLIGNLLAFGAPGQAAAAPAGPVYPVVFVPGTAASFLMAPDRHWFYWFSMGQDATNSGALDGALKGCGVGTIGGAPGCVIGAVIGGLIGSSYLNPDSDLWKLVLNPDGSDKAPVRVGGVMGTLKFGGDSGPDLPGGAGNVYQTFLDDMAAHGYSSSGPNHWLYTAPYDWRKSPDYNARQYILPQVRQALADHPGAQKVVLIAHSQGGVVARSFVAGFYTDADGTSYHGGDKVAAMVAIATPWLGTPRVAQAASIGWDFGIPGVNSKWGPVLAPNWPAAYAMMPSNDEYFANYPDGYYYQGGADQNGKHGEPSLPQDQQNAIISEQNRKQGGDLMAQALRWRAQVLDGQSYGVRNYLIAGEIKPETNGRQMKLQDLGESPTDTILRVVRYTPEGYHCLFWNCWTYQKDEEDYVDVGAGDNTIPLASALAWSPANGPLPGWPGSYNKMTGPASVPKSVIGPYSYFIVTDQDGKGTSDEYSAKHTNLPNNKHVRDTIFSILSGLITVTSGTLPAGTLGQPYSARLSATGGTGSYTWSSAADLSVYGLSLSRDGQISGSLRSSPVGFRVTVTDSAGNTASGEVSVPVQFPPMQIEQPPAADVGIGYDRIISASGGVAPIVTAQIGLPGWVRIKCFYAGTCELQGIPPASGTYSFRLKLTDRGPGTEVWQNETLTVNPQPSITTSNTRITVAPGQLIQRQFQAADGATPYRWGAMNNPSWLNISADGLLTGTPPEAGQWSVRVLLEDAAGAWAYTDLTVAAVGPLSVTTASLPEGVEGYPYGYPYSRTISLEASGGSPPYSWFATGLPPGLNLDSESGRITGTPLQSGTYPVDVTVTDSTGIKASGTPSLMIVSTPKISTISPSAGPAAGGNTVTITGSGLTGTSAVTFGPRAAASLQVQSDTKLTAVVPAGSGQVTVSVKSPGGTSNVLSYTYQQPASQPAGPLQVTGAFRRTSALPGAAVTFSGTAQPGTYMSVYFYCKGCSGEHVGVAQVNASGAYSLTFQVPAKAQPGPAYVAAGCDSCGNGWHIFRGLTIGAAGRRQPPPSGALP